MAVSKRAWTHNGRKRTAWCVDFSLGPSPQDRVRRSGFATRREAEEYEREERERHSAAQRLARLPAEERRRHAAADMTVADLAKSWLEECKFGTASGAPVEPRTYSNYEASVRRHILPRFGATPVAEIDGPLLMKLQAALVRQASAPTTRRVLQHVRQMLNHAVRIGVMASSPGAAIRHRMDQRAKPKLRMPTDGQFSALLNAVDALRKDAEAERTRCRQERPADPAAGAGFAAVARSWAGFGLMLKVLAVTGLRVSEVLALTWADLTLDRLPVLKVERRAGQDGSIGLPKSATSRRTVVLPTTLVDELRNWREEQPGIVELIFPSSEGRVQRYPNIYRRRLLPAMRKADLLTPEGRLPFALHAPRHYHASALIAAGLNVKEVADQLGHADATLTLTTYGHLFEDGGEQRRRAVEKVHARLEAGDADKLKR